MKIKNYLQTIGVLALLITAGCLFYWMTTKNNYPAVERRPIEKPADNFDLNETASPTSTPTIVASVVDLPQRKILSGGKQVYQTFNNCGPASLSMALSYYKINVSQAELGNQLRPYQNQKGDNDDKAVTFNEMAAKAEEYDFQVYSRPAGDIEMIQKFIGLDIPVVVKTWLKPDEDIGHFRIIKGYDRNKNILIQDDSYQGKNIAYSYQEFNNLWQAFSNEFLVLVPKEKIEKAELVLGPLVDKSYAWQKVFDSADSRFNQLRANYYLGNYQQAVDIFEEIKNDLPRRMLWYQIEPILAYYQLGEYNRVLELTEDIFDSQNRAFSELHYLRAKIFEKRGEADKADEEYRLADVYNSSDYWKTNLP
jgi:tetratricopeptide (TPR) repeat protein